MNGHNAPKLRQPYRNVPSKIVVPLLHEDEESNSVEVDLDALNDDPTELCLLLEAERTSHLNWIIIALAYVKQGKTDEAIEIMTKGLEAPSVRSERTESVPLQSTLLWLYLHKSRKAMRAPFNAGERHEDKTKEYYLQQATALLNALSRFDPDHPAYVMGRASYSNLKAAVTSSKQEKQANCDLATKLFEDPVKRTNGSNMFAQMGRARMLFHKKKYTLALEAYQDVLRKRPNMDPDPRIGIGLCFWMLGHKEDAKYAWERAQELDPESKVAKTLLGAYHLWFSSTLSEHDPNFAVHYKLAIDYIQKAYKMDKELPLACTLFASYFFSAGNFTNVELLSKKAIEFSDVGQISSDAYYLLGRTCQEKKEYELARQYFARSESAREDSSYLPAKIGMGQLQILMKDMTGAKFIFENLLKTHSKCLEAMAILGTLYAMEVFENAASTASPKEDKSAEHKKAILYLEKVRNSWKDSSKHMAPNPAVLLTLARLYENNQPEKALSCLQKVADIERDASDNPEEVLLSPRLLNNMAVFHYAARRYDQARELFQSAMENGKALMEKGEITDFDSILATMTYNLGRLEEAAGNDDEATKYYEQVLSRQKDYLEASMRLAYLGVKKGTEDGHKKLNELMKNNDYNLELCSLYGWYLSKQPKKLPLNIAEDREQRHYKRTLQTFDKHDRYSLTGMGNLYLIMAREMRRDTDADREKRKRTYERAVEFFEKALQLDPTNAYAAQGTAIAVIEDRRDYTTAVNILNRVRETIKDASVFINLGHSLTEVKQYTKAIENYETAINNYGAGDDPWILTCVGKVWLLKGKMEQSITCLNTALSYAKKALALSPEQPIYMFNVAFVQVQICNLIQSLPQTKRTVKDIQEALDGLEEAIQTFMDVAKSKKPPYPAADIEQRSTMGKNTTRKQLKTLLEAQTKYEDANAAKIAEAKRVREEEARKREEELEKLKKEQEEKNRKLAEDRRLLQEQAAEWARRKESESALEKEEQERKASRRKEGGGIGTGRQSKRSKKSGDRDADSADDDTPAEDGRAKKRRKLVSKKKNMKSADFIDDSDDLLSDEDDLVVNPAKGGASRSRSRSRSRSASLSASMTASPPPAESSSKSKKIVDSDDDLDDDVEPAVRSRRPARRIADDDDDDEEMRDDE